MKLLYFAWVKQKAGLAEEDVSDGQHPKPARDLVTCFSKSRFVHIFADLAVIRCAVDQEHGGLDTPVAGAQEIAFFPPVTGG